MATTSNDPERLSAFGWILRGWNQISLLLALSAAAFVAGSLVVKQIRYRRWRQEEAIFDVKYGGRGLAQKVLENYNNLLDTEWTLSESDRFGQAMEITAKQERESLAGIRAKLERYTVAVRGGKLTEDKDLIGAALAEGRFSLAADEARRAARAAAAKRIELNRRNAGRSDSSSDSPEEETALLELAASALTASRQDELALPLLADALNLTNREEEEAWSEIQSQIGCTHLRMASRLAPRAGRDHLDQAIAALRLADEAAPSTHRSSEKSVRLYSLGTALLERAERSSAAEAAPLVKEAAHFLQLALDGQSAKDYPLGWIYVAQELAEAHREDVSQRTDFERRHSSERAVESIRVCAERIDRGQAPRDWAAAESELGDALLQLATGQTGKVDRARIEDAISVQRQAMETIQRDREPRLWARTQAHLALALSRLGEATDGNGRAAEYYLEAAAAGRKSLEVVTPVQAPIAWAKSELNLSHFLFAAVSRSAPQAATLLEEAIRARAAALTVLTETEFPRLFTQASNLGAAASPESK